jgi:hypothetical protein
VYPHLWKSPHLRAGVRPGRGGPRRAGRFVCSRALPRREPAGPGRAAPRGSRAGVAPDALQPRWKARLTRPPRRAAPAPRSSGAARPHASAPAAAPSRAAQRQCGAPASRGGLSDPRWMDAAPASWRGAPARRAAPRPARAARRRPCGGSRRRRCKVAESTSALSHPRPPQGSLQVCLLLWGCPLLRAGVRLARAGPRRAGRFVQAAPCAGGSPRGWAAQRREAPVQASHPTRFSLGGKLA